MNTNLILIGAIVLLIALTVIYGFAAPRDTNHPKSINDLHSADKTETEKTSPTILSTPDNPPKIIDPVPEEPPTSPAY